MAVSDVFHPSVVTQSASRSFATTHIYERSITHPHTPNEEDLMFLTPQATTSIAQQRMTQRMHDANMSRLARVGKLARPGQPTNDGQIRSSNNHVSDRHAGCGVSCCSAEQLP